MNEFDLLLLSSFLGMFLVAWSVVYFLRRRNNDCTHYECVNCGNEQESKQNANRGKNYYSENSFNCFSSVYEEERNEEQKNA